MLRVTQLVQKLDSDYSDFVIVLVSHGDVLQITQAAFARLPAGQHRSVAHLNNAQSRHVTLNNTNQ